MLIARSYTSSTFKVMSVKSNLSGLAQSTDINILGDRIRGANLSLRTLVLQAYGLFDFQIVDGPAGQALGMTGGCSVGFAIYNHGMRLTDSISLCVLAWMLQATVPDAPSATGKRLFSHDFRGGMARWVAEMEKPATIQVRGNVLDLDAPAGCTLWFRPELQSPLMIQYEARMVHAGGPNDRVSDLNAFWLATDARSPNDLFASKRSAKFSEYNQLRT